MTNDAEKRDRTLSRLMTQLFDRLLCGARPLGMSWKEFYESGRQAKASARAHPKTLGKSIA